MSQITTIDQCRCLDAVFHPIYGRGKVLCVGNHKIMVLFPDYVFTLSESKVVTFLDDSDGKIDMLYSEEIYICTRKIESETRYDNGKVEYKYSYEPVKPEQ